MISENKKEDSLSIRMMNELEPINPTEYDESDDIEAGKVADAKEEMSELELKAYNEVVKERWNWYGEGKD